MKDNSLRNYLIWAFAIAWPLQALASWFALRGNALVFTLLLALCMFAPFAAVLLAKIPLRGMGWKPALRGKWKWLVAAWVGPMVLAVLGGVIYYLIFPSRLDFSGAYLKAQLSAQVGEENIGAVLSQMEQQGLSLPLLNLIQIVQAATYAPLVNAALALGEEVGWRGAMLPRLKERFGRRVGWLLGGVIWGVWHWPVIILAGYEYGLVYWGAPVLGPLLFCLFTIACGLLLDLLYEKTRCIWIPALGHGAVNAAAGIPVLFLNPAHADQLILGPCMNGLIAGIPLFLLAAAVLFKAKKPEEV